MSLSPAGDPVITGAVRFGELDREGAWRPLTDVDVGVLADTGLVDLRREDAGWRMLPRGKVGSVRTASGLQVDVLPKDKVGLTRVLFLLGYAQNPGFLDVDVEHAVAADLWPAMAQALVRYTRRALGTGVLQGYVTHDEALRTVRGRIRIGDQLARHPGRTIPIEVSYDDYTVDIPENRILRTALRRMLAVPGLDDGTRAGLAHLDNRLDGARVLHPRRARPTWRTGRLNERYVPALRLSELVLDHTSLEMGDPHAPGCAFVVDMASVFEDFVVTALREGLAERPGTTESQYPSRLDVPESCSRSVGIPMRVDVVHTVSGRPRLIFDAKYKAAGPSGTYPNADHYQMLAYLTALERRVGWLVYAGPGQRQTRGIVHTDKQVVEFPVDLSLSPLGLLARIRQLATEAWEWSLPGQVNS